MIEKVILALAITVSLYLSIQARPQQRSVAIDIEHPVETFTLVWG